MNEPKKHISYSQINLASNCGEAYRRRYINGEIIPPGIALVKGISIHEAARYNHRQKRKSQKDLPLKEIEEIAVETLHSTKRERGILLSETETSMGLTKTMDKAERSVLKLAGVYTNLAAPSIMPDLVEQPIHIEVSSSPYNLFGIVDVVTTDKRIIDFKTASRSKRQEDADRSIQLTWYGLSYRALTSSLPSRFELQVLIDTKSKSKHQVLITDRNERDYDVLVNRINNFIKYLQAGIFPPANVGHWICSPKWCGYWWTCKYVNSDRQAAAKGG